METKPFRVEIPEAALRQAEAQGPDALVRLFADAIANAAGGTLDADALQRLDAEQVTLWGYALLHDELMDGGFVQLIHNGYGPFFFRNPFAKAMRLWGIDELAKLINKARKLYEKHGKELERERSEEEFMALFEQYPGFDDLDDTFVEEEENIQAAVARHVGEHTDKFAVIV